MTLFHLARTNYERKNKGEAGAMGLLVPLTIAGLPAVGYAAFARSAPPEAAVMGLIFSALSHGLDRSSVSTYTKFAGKPF